MDRKSIIIVVISFLVMVLWYPLVVNKLYPPRPLPAGQTNLVSSASNAPSLGQTPASSLVAETPAAAPQIKQVVGTNVPETLLEITNNLAHYTFSSHGGGLTRVELLRYPETVSVRDQGQSNRFATLNLFTESPTLSVLDGPALQGDGVFELRAESGGVVAEKTLPNGLKIAYDYDPGRRALQIRERCANLCR